MSRPFSLRPSRLRLLSVAVAALLSAGCADSIASMTQHYFYGYVTGVHKHDLCLNNARTEAKDQQVCFGWTHQTRVAVGDLVKVQYERIEEGSHPGGNAVTVEMVEEGKRATP